MIRPDIEVVQSKESITINSAKSFISFDKKGKKIYSTAILTSEMLNDIESSKISKIKECNFEEGFILLKPLDFFNIEKFTDVLISIFEKYEL